MKLVDKILDRFVGGILDKSKLGRDVVEKLRIRDSYKNVFGSPDGKIVLRHILRYSHVGKSTYAKGDVNLMLIREGERRLALSILRFVCTDVDELQTTIEETQNNGQ